MPRPARYRSAFLLLIAVSVLLRVALCVRGGQRFFPDENRYLRSLILLRHLEGAQVGSALDHVLTNPDHTGYILVGLVPAFVQQTTLRALGGPADREAVDRSLWLPACMLSLASVASIVLVAALARRLGAGDPETLVAAALMSASTAVLYYARHLLPYDSAMALALLALWLGLAPASSFARSAGVGLVAGAALLTYNGYWLTVAAALALHVFAGDRSLRERVRRAAAAGLALLAIPAALSASSAYRGLGLFARKMARFSRLASTDADLSEGFTLPWEYLWHAEHGLLLVFAAGLAGVLWCWREPGARRGRLWLAVVLGMYAAMGLMSVGLERVGTFGRLSRQMVPFLCLATAFAAAALMASLRPPPRLIAALGLLLGVQAAFNFAQPIAQRFPREVARELQARYGPLAEATSLLAAPPPQEPASGDSRYVLLNARYLHGIVGKAKQPPGRTLFRAAHPQQYLPYQYEGLVPVERELVRSTDISLRLVDLLAR